MNEVVPLSKNFDQLKAKIEGRPVQGCAVQAQGAQFTGKKEKHHRGEDDSMIKPLVGSEVTLSLRNGLSLTGVLRKASKFELDIETSEQRLIIPKHSIDMIRVLESRSR